MIRYTLPDFTSGLGLNLFFLRLLETNPEYFADKVAIDSVYGCFPSCIANGGRTFIRDRYSRAQMEETFGHLAHYGVKIRLTLTNMLLEEKHLADPYLNEMLEVARDFDTEVIVYADVLDAYIREQFGFKRVLSTTKALEDVSALNEATKQYDYVVLSYNKNKDRSFIDEIEDKQKIEVMVNEFCSPQCPYREAHYRHNSQDQLDQTIRPFRSCNLEQGTFFKHEANHPVIFNDNQVRELHDECGIEYYKIVGRGVPFETVLESYVYYLLKPAYRENIKRLVMTAAGR